MTLKTLIAAAVAAAFAIPLAAQADDKASSGSYGGTTAAPALAAAAGRRTARRGASLDIDAKRGERAAVKLSGGLELAVFLRLLHRRDRLGIESSVRRSGVIAGGSQCPLAGRDRSCVIHERPPIGGVGRR